MLLTDTLPTQRKEKLHMITTAQSKTDLIKRIVTFALALLLLSPLFPRFATKADAVRTYCGQAYYFASVIDENAVLDVANGSHENSTNIQIYHSNETDAQVFALEKSEVEGYVYIVHIASGKVLDVAGGRTESGTNVQLYEKNGSDAQLWKPYLAYGSEESLSFKSKCGKFLDISGGETTDGTNIWVYDGNNSPAQAFKLIPVDMYMYISTSRPGSRLNMRSAPSTDAKILAKLDFGTRVQALSTGNAGWTKIAYGGQEGYVSSDYLSMKNPSEKTSTDGSMESKIADRLNAMMSGEYKKETYKLGSRYEGPYAAEQCKGFAKSVYQQLFGYNIGSTSKKPKNYTISINSNKTCQIGAMTDLGNKSDSELKALLRQARPGDFLQVRRSHGGSHSMIVISTNDSGVTVYECNVDGKNGIEKNTYTWSEFRSKNSAMGLYTPRDYSLHG